MHSLPTYKYYHFIRAYADLCFVSWCCGCIAFNLFYLSISIYYRLFYLATERKMLLVFLIIIIYIRWYELVVMVNFEVVVCLGDKKIWETSQKPNHFCWWCVSLEIYSKWDRFPMRKTQKKWRLKIACYHFHLSFPLVHIYGTRIFIREHICNVCTFAAFCWKGILVFFLEESHIKSKNSSGLMLFCEILVWRFVGLQ